jgi:hypothetical protein
MLRLIHNQTVQGPILVDDIDDGLPNKNVHRLGSTADPDAYVRDGIIGKPKQPCYISRTQTAAGFPLVQGYINLNETQRVTLSAGKGKIFGLQNAGLITTVSFIASDIIAPVLGVAQLNNPVPLALSLIGTTFVSVSPDSTTVIITGVGAVTLTAAQILLAGGLVTPALIVIPPILVPGIVVAGSLVQVLANEQYTAIVPVTP